MITIRYTIPKKKKKSINNRIHVLTTMLLNSTIFFIQAFILVPKKNPKYLEYNYGNPLSMHNYEYNNRNPLCQPFYFGVQQ